MIALSLTMALLATPLLAPPVPEADEARRDEVRLQGRWRLVSCQFMGGEMCDGGKLHNQVVTIRIKGTTVTWRDGAKTETEPVKLDPAKKPRAIDFGEGKQVNRAIYQVEENRLKLCFFAVLGDRRLIQDTPRPTRFDDEYRVVMQFEREER